MNWEDHNRWAKKLGISESIANGVNSLIDGGDEELSHEFNRNKGSLVSEAMENQEVSSRRNSAFEVIIGNNVEKHDAARNLTTDSKIYADVQLRFLQQKGEDYVTAWFLHHHLDYISEEQNSGKHLVRLLREHQTKYPQTFSQDIANFLIKHNKELIQELKL